MCFLGESLRTLGNVVFCREQGLQFLTRAGTKVLTVFIRFNGNFVTASVCVVLGVSSAASEGSVLWALTPGIISFLSPPENSFFKSLFLDSCLVVSIIRSFLFACIVISLLRFVISLVLSIFCFVVQLVISLVVSDRINSLVIEANFGLFGSRADAKLFRRTFVTKAYSRE
jgi:hypothetical protein